MASFLKECSDISVTDCYCDLRYPFWHVHGLEIADSELTDRCRAALWYSDRIEIRGTQMHGIKALRECDGVKISGCDIDSPEFGWFSRHISMDNTRAVSEYFMLRAYDLRLNNVDFTGSIPSNTRTTWNLRAARSTPKMPSGTRKTWWCAIAM